MPGVHPGDLGVAGIVRAGKRPDLLTSLLGPTGQPQMAPSGGGGGVLSMLGAGAGAGAGAGPIPGVGQVQPRLRMPELPHGVPYGASGAALYLAGAPDAAVDAALKMEGLHEERDVRALKSYLHGWKSGQGDWDPRGGDNPWCAAFVGASLAKAGIKGTNSAMATSYLNWGERVREGYKKGDVVVMSRGGGTPSPGAKGHIAQLTGRYDPKTGKYETIEGNIDDQVVRNWRNLSALNVRRATERERMEAARQQPTAAGPAAGPTASAASAGQAGDNEPSQKLQEHVKFWEAGGENPHLVALFPMLPPGALAMERIRSRGIPRTKAEAAKLMNDALRESRARIEQRWPNAPEGIKQALTSLDYNSGFTRSGKTRATALRAALDRSDYATARKLFLRIASHPC